MKIKFGNASFDTDSFETYQELFDIITNIEGQDKLDKKLPESCKGYEVFDELLPKETALFNLLIALNAIKRKHTDELFPVEINKAYSYLAYQKQEKNFQLPSVDAERYATLNKIVLAQRIVDDYFNMCLYSRLGYGLCISVLNGGKIHVLSDLRELHKAGI